MKDGVIADATRIERTAPTIHDLAARGARVVVISHRGRPQGKVAGELSLRPVAPALAAALGGHAVTFAADCTGPETEGVVAAMEAGGIVLLENLRFHAGEEDNDTDFARELAALGELYVNDAFSCAHRAHASVDALARLPCGSFNTVKRVIAILLYQLEAFRNGNVELAMGLAAQALR